MNESPISKCCLKPIAIRFNPTESDEKLAFVENVCSLLVKSRFGMDRPYSLIADLSGGPAPHLFYDLTNEGPIGSYYTEVNTDSIVDVVTKYFRSIDTAAAFERFRAIDGQTGSPSNLGRGSPACAQSAASGR